MHKRYKILLSLFLTAVLFLAFTPPLNPTAGGWTQQFMPNIGNRQITDITFLDSLTGYAVTNSNGQYDTAYILKTTSGGDNWFINYTRTAWFTGFNRIKFLNQNIGFVCGVSVYNGPKGLTKTTNGGINWLDLNVPDPNVSYLSMSVYNQDTIWLTGCNGFYDVVWRTTNGGASWQEQLTWGSLQNTNIYIYNSRIGFACCSSPASTWKTTNGGENWSINLSNENFTDMHFVDSLTGWKCTNSSSQAGTLKKTTDGGLNWTIQNLPPESPPFSFSRMYKFSFVNKDTIWGIGGIYNFGSGQSRGVIYKTTNGGINWGYQIPDTSINIYIYNTIQFVNKKIGWAYSPLMGGVHTTTGGDTITGIQSISNEIPKSFKLGQNYPNPFNPRTIISYELRITSSVEMSVNDITGRHIIDLVNQKHNAGKYQVDFSGQGLSSGVYFYKMTVTDDKSRIVYTETKKMVLIK